ncbi:FAD-dependent oxidoreductase [Kitasatospora sp. NPDC048239]|uniref:FAD-dependent oxidoreductase n=1 Tax=Kitasatospora sp. NPDC048239 TaxID=3364046 RepID=UPI0037109832
MSAPRPVVIAGAGITGLFTAAELARAGVPVVVLERSAPGERTAAGVALNTAAVAVLERRGLFAELREGALALPQVHFSLLWLDPDRAGGPSRYPYLLAQSRVEERIEAELAAAAEVEIRRGHQVTGLTQDDERVLVEVEGPDGPYRLEAAYLVGADGPHSTVRQLAGIAFEGAAAESSGLVADIRVDFAEVPPEVFGARWFERGLFMGAPVGPDRLRLITTEFGTPPAAPAGPVTGEELAKAAVRIADLDLGVPEPLWSARFDDAARQADRYRAGRVLLAGDAAHVHYPLGGLALSTALEDALNLGWKLAATVRGRAPEGLLDSYEAERRPAGRAALRATRAQTALLHPAEKVGPLREILRELVAFDGPNQFLVDLAGGVGLRYELPLPEGAGEPHPLIGRLVPDVELVTPEGPLSPAGRLRDGRGLLVRFAQGPEVGGWTDRVDVLTAEPHPELDAAALLIRPDGHVAAVTDDPGTLRHALTTWFGEAV